MPILRRSSRRPGQPRRQGQAVVEFALAVIPFLILLMGVIDLGRGIYMMNGTSEAARDIARVTIVHLTNISGTVGLSDETAKVIATQTGLIPGLEVDASTDIDCVDAYGVVQKSLGNGTDCTVGEDFIRVRVKASLHADHAARQRVRQPHVRLQQPDADPMSNEGRPMRRTDSARRGQRGQIIILFVLAIFVIVGVVGVVLDGGAAYAMRRQEQSVADLSAMAGATAFLNTPACGRPRTRRQTRRPARSRRRTASPTASRAPRSCVEIANAFAASNVTVDLTGVHTNNFAAILGMPTWDVSVTATAMASDRPNGAIGAMPLLFNQEAFPGAVCDEEATGCTPEVYQLPGTGNEDVPQDATQFNWTIFCTASGNPCNANSNGVRDIIQGGGNATTVYINDDIGPLNAGTHTTLFNDLSDAHRRDRSRSRSSTTRGRWSASATSSSSTSRARRTRSSGATSSPRSTRRSSWSRRRAATRRSSPVSIGSRS